MSRTHVCLAGFWAYALIVMAQMVPTPGPGTVAPKGIQPIDPTTLTGCSVYTADSVTCTGGCSGTNPVTAIADISSIGNNLTAVTAGTYVASWLNGKPGVHFTAASLQYYAFGTAINLQSGGTVFAVVQLDATGGAISAIIGPSGSGGLAYLLNTSPNYQLSDKAGTGAIIAGTLAADTSPHQLSETWNNVTGSLRIDEASDGSGSPTSRSITANEAWVGRSYGAVWYMNGTIGEVTVCNSVQSLATRQGVEVFLKSSASTGGGYGV